MVDLGRHCIRSAHGCIRVCGSVIVLDTYYESEPELI